jgi:2-phosphoglycerate kinase
MDQLKIKKRDKSIEGWSDDKLITSMSKAGVPIDKAQKIAGDIKNWARKNAVNYVVTSVELRDKVIESIKVEFPAQADSYQAFKK